VLGVTFAFAVTSLLLGLELIVEEINDWRAKRKAYWDTPLRLMVEEVCPRCYSIRTHHSQRTRFLLCADCNYGGDWGGEWLPRREVEKYKLPHYQKED
jgi:hypothetical protein